MNISFLSQIPQARNSQASLLVQWTGRRQMIVKEEGAKKKDALDGTVGRGWGTQGKMQRRCSFGEFRLKTDQRKNSIPGKKYIGTIYEV